MSSSNLNFTTAIVTGSAGFIGFHLCKKLLSNGCNVLGIDNFNEYYDVALKRDRTAILSKFPSFTLVELDIADGVNLLHSVESYTTRIGVRCDQ